jgi:hypothetical protein
VQSGQQLRQCTADEFGHGRQRACRLVEVVGRPQLAGPHRGAEPFGEHRGGDRGNGGVRQAAAPDPRVRSGRVDAPVGLVVGREPPVDGEGELAGIPACPRQDARQ